MDEREATDGTEDIMIRECETGPWKRTEMVCVHIGGVGSV